MYINANVGGIKNHLLITGIFPQTINMNETAVCTGSLSRFYLFIYLLIQRKVWDESIVYRRSNMTEDGNELPFGLSAMLRVVLS